MNIVGKGHQNQVLYAVEMEGTRYESLRKAAGDRSYNLTKNLIHGNAFQVQAEKGEHGGISVLFLNPPYDLDRVHGRLETKFLDRFAHTLTLGGILFYIVPHYALASAAKILATEFENVRCFKYPEPEFQEFKQVVLFAQKVETRRAADSTIVAQVEAWSKDPTQLRELPNMASEPLATIPEMEKYQEGLESFTLRKVDTTALLGKVRPWMASTRTGALAPVRGVFPELPIDQLLLRRYPVATPVRPAHIAAGIAAGVFNGSFVSAPGMPDLLVKGVFHQEFVTVEERVNKKGDTTGYVQVQQPRLVVTVLDLSTNEYHTLKQGTDLYRTVSQMTVSGLLHHYSDSLLHVMNDMCPVTYNPHRDGDKIKLGHTTRPLYDAQQHAVKALLTLLGGDCSLRERQGRAAILLGEIGVGKCLKIGTLVMKFDGSLVPVEEIRKNDLLMGPDSTPRKVLGTTRGQGPLYEVRPIIGDPWVCNDAHILTLVHTMSDDVFDIPVQEYVNSERLTRELSRGGRRTHPVSEFKQFTPEGGVDFPPLPEPEIDPYFLGIWYGDGTKSLEAVQVTTADEPVLTCLHDIALKYDLQVKNYNRPITYNLSRGQEVRPNTLLRALKIVVGDGKRLPIACVRGSKAVRKSFLAGFLDSDGHLTKNGSFDLIQKRKEWTEDICFIARSLGFRATPPRPEPKSAYRDREGGIYWRTTISGDFTSIPTRLVRKQSRPRALLRLNRKVPLKEREHHTVHKIYERTSRMHRRTHHVNRTGIKVEPIGIGEYAGFELDGDGRFLLGDFTVTHNTTCALSALTTMGSKRPLVMCPPHLLSTWMEETGKVLPGVRFQLLESITDLETLERDTSEGMIVSILSRETAKLSHRWEGVGETCPKCGRATPKGDLAKKRARCEHKSVIKSGLFHQLTEHLAYKLAPYAPTNADVIDVLNNRIGVKLRATFEAAEVKPEFTSVEPKYFREALTQLLEKDTFSKYHQRAVLWILMALNDDAITASVVETLLPSVYQSRKELARDVLLLLPPSSEIQTELLSKARAQDRYGYTFNHFESTVRDARDGKSYVTVAELQLSWLDGELTVAKIAAGSLESHLKVLEYGLNLVNRKVGSACGEFLYQAIPEPRKVALAPFIQKRYSKTFDSLVIDECFVSGTKVSGFPIEQISVGDLVDAYDEVTGKVTKSRVTRKWIRRPKGLLRVHFSNGSSFICTPNHPVFTDRGWVAAESLLPTDRIGVLNAKESGTLDRNVRTMWCGVFPERESCEQSEKRGQEVLRTEMLWDNSPPVKNTSSLGRELSLVQQEPKAIRAGSYRTSKKRVGLLRQYLCQVRPEQKNRAIQFYNHQAKFRPVSFDHVNSQSDVQLRKCAKDASEFKGSDVLIQRGEWKNNPSTTSPSSSIRGKLGAGVTHNYSTRQVPLPKFTQSLQSGYSERSLQVSDRSGRSDTQATQVEVLGPTQDKGLGSTWVEGITVLEPGSDGRFGGLCPDGFVYNLEVEGTHTYFAENILVHNCHEYSTDGSAQERSAHRLTGLGLPTILMTGSLMNGYAESLFANMWAISSDFRQEFQRSERRKFVDRYGYRKRLLRELDDREATTVEHGSSSDRVETSEVNIGNAPGVLPLFLLRHLLPISVTLHKADLALELPECTQERIEVAPDAEVMRRYKGLLDDLVKRIRKDRYDKERAGKLFGMLGELPSYLDRATCDTGNMEDGSYAIHYPESLNSEIISQVEGLPADTILPKERWMLDCIKREIAEGRNVLVFGWHLSILPRLARLIEAEIGEKAPILYADKVATGKRQEWITKNIVKKRAKVMVANPVAIQTGLNNLVHFSTEIWFENPACNPVTYRQAVGRVDRIGQNKPTRIYFPVYDTTLQVELHKLLLDKVAVSTATDGLDPESSLLAAGAGPDDYMTGLSIGKQLWALLNKQGHSGVAQMSLF